MKYFAGVDEVGRGPLAGPVVAAAVVFKEGECYSQFTDSKSLSEKKRNLLSDEIVEKCDSWAIVAVGPITIDQINIRQATHLAMKCAVETLVPDHSFIDGNMRLETDLSHETIIKGDSTNFMIGAASILAKVWRDTLMEKYDEKFPGYGLAKHKGYPSKAHGEALQEYGVTPIHRYSFKSVKELPRSVEQRPLSAEEGDLFIISSKKGDSPRRFPGVEFEGTWGTGREVNGGVPGGVGL